MQRHAKYCVTIRLGGTRCCRRDIYGTQTENVDTHKRQYLHVCCNSNVATAIIDIRLPSGPALRCIMQYNNNILMRVYMYTFTSCVVPSFDLYSRVQRSSTTTSLCPFGIKIFMGKPMYDTRVVVWRFLYIYSLMFGFPMCLRSETSRHILNKLRHFIVSYNPLCLRPVWHNITRRRLVKTIWGKNIIRCRVMARLMLPVWTTNAQHHVNPQLFDVQSVHVFVASLIVQRSFVLLRYWQQVETWPGRSSASTQRSSTRNVMAVPSENAIDF